MERVCLSAVNVEHIKGSITGVGVYYFTLADGQVLRIEVV